MTNNNNVHIALAMMVKNESARIHVSLESVKGYVNSCIIYDTGSTDGTIEIISKFCEESNILFRLKQGEFVDFSTSRNVLLDFADTFTDVNYLLMLDCNDELQSGNELRAVCQEYLCKNVNAFHLLQKWEVGMETHTYYNIRLLKPRSNWRYKCKVHEYIIKENATEPVVRIENVIIYQNRNMDTDGKTGRRFVRDKELLTSAYKEDPLEPRTLFYLAQTLECLNEYENALQMYNERIKTPQTGFIEEIFHAWLRGGKLCLLLNKGWEVASGYFMKALEFDRIEPLLPIIDYYRSKSMWGLAYYFAKMTCAMKFPTHCVLFVEDKHYKYTRWHIMGSLGYFVGTDEAYRDGKNACLEAIRALNNESDKKNLGFYLNHEKDVLKESRISQIKNRKK